MIHSSAYAGIEGKPDNVPDGSRGLSLDWRDLNAVLLPLADLKYRQDGRAREEEGDVRELLAWDLVSDANNVVQTSLPGQIRRPEA